MDKERLEAGLPGLLGHMREVGYSDGYVASTERVAMRLIGARQVDSWDDAFAWASAGERGGRPYMGAHVRLLMRFVEGAGLPRTEAYPGRASTSARDGLGPGMAAVLDAYESCPAAAGKARTTVRAEVSAAACFLARLEAEGVATPAEATEGDVLAIVTDADGAPAWSRTVVRQAKAVLAASGIEGCGRLASLIPVPREWCWSRVILAANSRTKIASHQPNQNGHHVRIHNLAYTGNACTPAIGGLWIRKNAMACKRL